MTIEEAHIRIKILVDKIDSSYYEEVLPEEIDEILNEEYLRYIKTHYGKNNIYRRGFDESQKRIDDLKNLVKSAFCNVTEVSYYDNVYRADLSNLFSDENLTTQSEEEYMLYLKGMAITCIGTCCKRNEVKLIQHDDISRIANDPFNKPTAINPVIFFEDSDVFVWVGDNESVNSFLVTFIKMPKKVSILPPVQEFEISSHAVSEIVVGASQIIIEMIESNRVQSNTQNLTLKE